MTEDLETRRGTVTTEDDGRQRVEFRRSWAEPIEDVWAALTEPDRLARWIGVYEGERHAGGTGTFAMTQEEGDAPGQPTTIVECDPPRRLVIEWPDASSKMERIDLDLGTEGGRTVLRFVQYFPPATDAVDWAIGWHWYLDKLGGEIDGSAVPTDWDAFMAEVGPGYRPA
jgi:uncharacterized protein YndB with AHSA1/START domain